MISIEVFTFNPFQENTYVLSDETSECLIIDPGCYEKFEREALADFIMREKLTPVKLLNTHCHLDHMLGNKFVADKYKLDLEMNDLDLPILTTAAEYGMVWGINADPSPLPKVNLKEGDSIKFGNSTLDILFTPGHSPGHITFYSKIQNFAISGDVLFLQSIGRTDLPGGDYGTLISTIKEKLLPLPEETTIYSGHGPSTTIGFEKQNNPFLN
ncbi:MBL fold metallo-hydrolase [bacterium AH-315-C07]|nr:MBL fold metallo-hydrolase [bacterium AH-315-C07]